MNSACRRNCWSSFKDMKTIRVVAAVIRSENKIFATARGYGAFKGQWEFPGGKIELNETKEEALKNAKNVKDGQIKLPKVV